MKDLSDNSTIGQRIKAIRTMNNKTQKEFAYSIGVSQAFLSSLENDRSKAPQSVVNKITKIYNLKSDWAEAYITNNITNKTTIDSNSSTDFQNGSDTLKLIKFYFKSSEALSDNLGNVLEQFILFEAVLTELSDLYRYSLRLNKVFMAGILPNDKVLPNITFEQFSARLNKLLILIEPFEDEITEINIAIKKFSKVFELMEEIVNEKY